MATKDEAEQLTCHQALLQLEEALRKGHTRKAAKLARTARAGFTRFEAGYSDLLRRVSERDAEHADALTRVSAALAMAAVQVPGWHERFARSWAQAAWTAGARGLDLGGKDPAEEVRIMLEAAGLPDEQKTAQQHRDDRARKGAELLADAMVIREQVEDAGEEPRPRRTRTRRAK